MPSFPPDIARQIATLTNEMNALKKILVGTGIRTGIIATGSLVTLTTSYQSILSVDLNIKNGDAQLWAVASVDYNVTTAAAGTAVASLTVDGVVPSGAGQQAIISTASVTRATVGQSWLVDLATGNRTIELKALKSASGAAVQLAATHTTLSYIVFDR